MVRVCLWWGKKKGKDSDTEGYCCISSLSSCLASENQWRRVVSGLLSSTSFFLAALNGFISSPSVLTLPFSFPSLFHSKPVTCPSLLCFTTRPCPFFSSSAVYWFIHAMFRCLAVEKKEKRRRSKLEEQKHSLHTHEYQCVFVCARVYILCCQNRYLWLFLCLYQVRAVVRASASRFVCTVSRTWMSESNGRHLHIHLGVAINSWPARTVLHHAETTDWFLNGRGADFTLRLSSRSK